MIMRGVFLFGILIFLQSLSVFAQNNKLNLCKRYLSSDIVI
jgi:hypothetical protein